MTSELAPSLQISAPYRGRTFGHYVGFSMQHAPDTVGLQWNRASNLEPSGPEVETLLLGHRGPVDSEGSAVNSFRTHALPLKVLLTLSSIKICWINLVQRNIMTLKTPP
ncbi:hypothetical protein AVEN_148695-1 [Araneus ventricosus]|uniref:Uncharacterized protein n=1 Tax=Araneus ventricosus TaxID=182803 RepID=A0A4Y2FRE7_ARAVE|nr:hypothetical protein AVEN_148695-1 [Araneus ventricosus]